MDTVTLKEVPALLATSPVWNLPHYDAAVIDRLLVIADEMSTSFTPHINRLLKELPEMSVMVDRGIPIVSSSAVVGQVSWMEDFTMFAIHPGRNWDLDLPRAVQASEYDLTVNCALGYHGHNGVQGEALIYDPNRPLSSKQRSDIKRACTSLGPVDVKVGPMPSFEELAAGVTRWNRHAMSGDYFLWQWLWVAAAGTSVCIEGADFKCWVGFVQYGDWRIFTAYHTTGAYKNGIGTACLQHALALLEEENPLPVRTILTAPMLPEQAARHNVARYETYKRRFANDSLPVHFLKGLWHDEPPYPPYYNAQTQETVYATNPTPETANA